MPAVIMALDQGTTSSRTILFNHKAEVLASASREFDCRFPKPGWVEQDAEDIWSSQKASMDEALAQAGLSMGDVSAIGITNQRETVIAWERKTGVPVGKAIVWQCRRTADYCDALIAEGYDETIKAKTGLVTDAYFSGTKVLWILRNIPPARELASQGELKVGTVDSWLIWKLTGGKTHATDVSNACRTMLYNIHDLDWDQDILDKFGIQPDCLPEVKECSGLLGVTDPDLFGREVPITGAAGDQQAALFGQACFDKGMTKITYGTGCFMVMNTGDEAVPSPSGLLTTIAWKMGGRTTYALEGSVFISGALMQWMRDGLHLFEDVAATEDMATSVPSTDGLYIVPAFVGLGAPYWDPYARGLIIGITRGTTSEHMVRAGLQSLAYQAYDLLGAMAGDSGVRLKSVRVDGGASANNYLCQFQADLLGINVSRPRFIETTALGAAFLAGLGAGVWKSLDELRGFWTQEREFMLSVSTEKVESCLRGWRKAVARARNWAKDD